MNTGENIPFHRPSEKQAVPVFRQTSLGKFEGRLCCAILFCLELKSLFEQLGRVLHTESIGLTKISSCCNRRTLHVELSKNFSTVAYGFF